MGAELKYYIAFNNGLAVLRDAGDLPAEEGRFFEGRTLEHLTGCRGTPEVVFAAVAFDGGYRTGDGGRSWQKVLDGDVRTFTVDPHDERVVYAGSGPVRLFRSEDMGLTWEPLDGLLALPESVRSRWGVPAAYEGKEWPHVRHIFIHPDDPALIHVALEHGGVVLSRDRGATWEDGSAGIGYLDMHMVRSAPGSHERYFVSSARGFYRSDDGGRTWRRTEEGMPWGYTERYSYSNEWLFCSGETPRMVVGGGKGSPGIWAREHTTPLGHVLLSDDGGETWRTSDGLPDAMPWMPWVLLHHPDERDTIFAGMGDGARGFGFDPAQRGAGAFYRSDDGGERWDCIMAETPSVLTAWVAAD